MDAIGVCAGERSLRFSDARGLVSAWRLDEVLPAMGVVEAAVATGLHAVGFVVYEAAPAFDSALVTRAPDPRLPLLRFSLFAARHELRAGDDLDRRNAGTDDTCTLGRWAAGIELARYGRDVERIRAFIAAGDTYQVNHTLRLTTTFSGDVRALYHRLVHAQGAAYNALLDVGDGLSIVSASPELFFRWRGDQLELRPMKGTRRRGRWTAEDDALAAELAASAKDRAENLMIVDLLRNDAGRVAEFGSVAVPRLFDVEPYETVHQMTSTITARTRAGTTLTDLFHALFPCGSVTGAPKVRTSQIITELEDAPRGIYTGAIGFVSPGEAVFSVAIRTLLLDARAGTAELGVGSGITWDSDADGEYAECLAKAAFTVYQPPAFDLLETLLWEPNGGFFLLDGHLARLRDSARRWGFRFREDAVRAALDEAVRGADAASRVRLVLRRQGAATAEAHPLDLAAVPLRVALCAEPVDSRYALLYHKTTHRGPYDRRRAARPDCDDVLLINERGELTEATLANLVVRHDGALYTPPQDSGLLPGVFRAEMLRRHHAVERALYPADLERAEEIYLVNSVRGMRRCVCV